MRAFKGMLCLLIVASLGVVLLGVATGSANTSDHAQGSPLVPFQRFVLDNGLVLVVHEDRRNPIAAVHVTYRVGARDEAPDQRGLAHLVEHLMFTGSANHDEPYYGALQEAGAFTFNGKTSHDFTTFTQVVPSGSLERVLWLEADRMGHLAPALTQSKLESQIGVVWNEMRLVLNQPSGQADLVERTFSYPADHPYASSVLGDSAALAVVTVDDVRAWLRAYYGAANAIVVITGDVDTDTVRAQVEQFFGNIPPGPPVTRTRTAHPPSSAGLTLQMRAHVPQPRLIKTWHTAETLSRDAWVMEAITWSLSIGRDARLRRRLVDETRLATETRAFHHMGQMGNLFGVQATAAPGVDLAALEREIDATIASFVADGPSPAELDRLKSTFESIHLGRLERIGGPYWGSRAEWLTRGEVVAEDPGFYADVFAWVDELTTDDMRKVADRWLGSGANVIEVTPLSRVASSADPSPPPDRPELRSLELPETPRVQVARAANGLEILYVERPELPLVEARLVVRAGFASDPPQKRGLSLLVARLLQDGPNREHATDVLAAIEREGGRIGSAVDPDAAVLTMSTTSANFAAALNGLGRILERPRFADSALLAARDEQEAAIAREKSQPVSAALRVLPARLFSEDHPYAGPLTGSGTPASLDAVKLRDVEKFFAEHYRPGNATLIVVGGLSGKKLLGIVDQAFRGWRGEAPTAAPVRGEVRMVPGVRLIDRPDAPQTLIIAGLALPPRSPEDGPELDLLHRILGGSFNSRINLNLREDKGWAYGAGTALRDVQLDRPFFAWASVQTDQTGPAIRELQSEIQEIAGERPITEEELVSARRQWLLDIVARWETNGALAESIVDLVRRSEPVDRLGGASERLQQTTLRQVNEEARRHLAGVQPVWIVIGDARRIRDSIEALELGSIF